MTKVTGLRFCRQRSFSFYSGVCSFKKKKRIKSMEFASYLLFPWCQATCPVAETWGPPAYSDAAEFLLTLRHEVTFLYQIAIQNSKFPKL